MRLKLSTVIIPVFLFLSCVTDKGVPGLEDRRWYLLEIEGDRDILSVNDKEPYIEFDGNSHKVGGNATCNNFFADYKIEGNSLSLGKPATTMVSCSEGKDQEYRFLQALMRIDSWKIIDNMLYLYEGEEPILIFENR